LTNYYDILEISQSATLTEIKTAFRKLSFKFHPDLNDDFNAEENFKKVNEAYQILSDPFLRALYDEKMKQTGNAFTYNPPPNHVYRSSPVTKKYNRSYRTILYAFLFLITAFIIFEATSSMSSVSTINEYKSNLSKKATDYYLHSPEKDKHIEVIIRRTNDLVEMFRNIPK
jgi:curved DNA-binding protein CbpA